MAVQNIEELVKLALSYEDQKLFDKAIESCNSIFKIDELSFQALAISCRCNLKTGEIEKAIGFAASLIKNYPENPDSYALRAVIHNAEGALRSELKSYEQALSVNSTHYESLCNIAGAYIEAGKLHAAADKIKRLKDVIPGDKNIDYLQGLLMGAENRFDDEIGVYQIALESFPENSDIWYNLGVALLAKHEYLEAIQAFRNSVDLDDSKIDVHFNLASAFFENKRYSDAERAFKRALDTFSDNGSLWYNLGYVQAAMKDYDHSIESYEKAISIETSQVVKVKSLSKAVMVNKILDDAYFNLAFIHFRRKNYTKAISSYKKVLELNPERFNAYYNLAFSLDKCKKYDEAIEVYKKILSFRPDDHKSYSKLAMVYHHTGQLDKMKSACLRSLEMERVSNSEAHYYLGVAAEDENDFETADSEYRKCLAQEADHKDAHLRRAVVLRKLKRYEDAKVQSKEAVRSLGSANAYYEMGRCYSLLSDDRKAVGAYRKAIHKTPTHQKSIIALIGLFSDDPDSVIKISKEAFSHKVKSSQLYYQYALALKSKSKYDKALKYAKKALSIKVDMATYGLIASLYSKTGDQSKAAKYKKKYDSFSN